MTTLRELIERTSKESPAAVKAVDGPTAVKLLKAVFATLARDIDQAPDGIYPVAALGNFRVRTVEADAEGKGGGRRVLFRAKLPKAPAAR